MYKLNSEITRNVNVMDEVISLAMEVENVKEIIIDNLMFDYLIFDSNEEVKNYAEGLILDYYLKEQELNNREVEIDLISLEDIIKTTLRIHKRLILSNIKAKYPDIYDYIKARAIRATNEIVGGICNG